MPATLVPFDDAVVLRPVRPKSVTADGIHVVKKIGDSAKRFGCVMAVGPGKIIAGAMRKMAIGGNTELVGKAPHPLDTSSPEKYGVEQIEIGPFTRAEDIPRYPVNVQVGDYVIFTMGMVYEIDPTEQFIVTRVEFIAGRIEGFVEGTDNDDDDTSKIVVPKRPHLVGLGGEPIGAA